MSFVQYPSSPQYHTSVEQKLLSRNAARQYKFGSPKLRDLLREKCRLRVREARCTRFDGARNTSVVGENSLVSKILRQELADLDSDLNTQENIYKELIGEMNMWFAEQQEAEEKYLIDVGDTDFVFCPVCEKAALEQSADQQIVCQCGICGTLDDLSKVIQSTISNHELQCSQLLIFFVEQNSDDKQKNLNAMCENCDYFISLT